MKTSILKSRSERGSLPAKSLSDAGIGAVVSAIDRATSIRQYRLGIKLMAQTLVRPAELVGAVWPDIDLEGRFWRIEHDKRRAGTGFPGRRVPLSRQAMETLQALRDLGAARSSLAPHEAAGEWVVSSQLQASQCARTDALGKVMRRAVEIAEAGGADVGGAVLYSMRKTGLDWLLERTDEPGLVDRLAGMPPSRGEREFAFNPERNMPRQEELMQAWADHLDRCVVLSVRGS